MAVKKSAKPARRHDWALVAFYPCCSPGAVNLSGSFNTDAYRSGTEQTLITAAAVRVGLSLRASTPEDSQT